MDPAQSYPLLSSRFANTTFILYTTASPPINASAWAGEIGGGRCLWNGGEGTRLTTCARAQDAQLSETAAKDPADSEWFFDGRACVLNGGRHGALEDLHVTGDSTKSDFATRSNARDVTSKVIICNNEKYMIRIASADTMRF
jgi:hypothetical protein